MDKKVYFDHTYTTDKNHLFWKKLSKLGFTVDTQTVHHPNSACRFISFGKRTYLEFIHQSKVKYKKPGIAFGSTEGLQDKGKKLKKKGMSCEFTHRNYEWKINSKDHLPGWNFLQFAYLGINTFFPWFITYDPVSGRSRRVKIYQHPNGVTGIIGHEFILNEAGWKFFSTIFNMKLTDKVTLSDGITFYFKRGRSNRHSKVILKSKSLEKTKAFMKTAEEIEFDDQEALLIKNPSDYKRMWDLVIV